MVNIPLAVSAQQVNYNLPGLRPATHLKLNGKILALMYQGSITSWNDPRIAAINPGVALPHTRVVPLHRADSSGDTFLFTSYLSTQDAPWDRVTGYGTTVNWPPVPGARAETRNTGMVAGCRATPGCVAYIGIAYLTSATNGGLGYASLRNALGAYEPPTPKTIGTAVAGFVSTTPVNQTISMVDGPAVTGYPIVNYEYAIVSTRQRSAAKARDIKAFLRWVITEGNARQYLDQFRFQPLRLTLLPAARASYAQENAALTAASAQATGLPWIVAMLILAIVLAFVLYRAQRWLSRSTHRVLNIGMLAATVALVVSAVWLIGSFAVARTDLQRAAGHGSEPAEALAQAAIDTQQARGYQVLNLISRSGDATFVKDFQAVRAKLGPGPGTLLAAAASSSSGADAHWAAAAGRDLQSW